MNCIVHVRSYMYAICEFEIVHAAPMAYFKDFDLIKNGSLFGYAPPEINQTRSHIGYHMATRPGAQRIKHQKINKKTRATAVRAIATRWPPAGS